MMLSSWSSHAYEYLALCKIKYKAVPFLAVPPWYFKSKFYYLVTKYENKQVLSYISIVSTIVFSVIKVKTFNTNF